VVFELLPKPLQLLERRFVMTSLRLSGEEIGGEATPGRTPTPKATRTVAKPTATCSTPERHREHRPFIRVPRNRWLEQPES
jgi:hypothetical protein